MKVKYKITEVRPKIFHVAFKDQYDMCMTFMRAQETYESPNPKFRNKVWNKHDFVRWYSKTYGNGAFTYPNDWSGFNVPSKIGEFVRDSLNKFPERRDFYDEYFEEIYHKCFHIIDNRIHDYSHRFYIIGTLEGAKQTIEHEIAHGFYYTLPSYKKEMQTLIKNLKPKFYNSLCDDLKRIGYTKQVFDDECQAFLATGWSSRLNTKLKNENKPFINVFEKYYIKNK